MTFSEIARLMTVLIIAIALVCDAPQTFSLHCDGKISRFSGLAAANGDALPCLLPMCLNYLSL